MIPAHCQKCGKKLKVPDKFSGKRVKCPGCGERLVIAAPVDVTAEATDEPVSVTPTENVDAPEVSPFSVIDRIWAQRFLIAFCLGGLVLGWAGGWASGRSDLQKQLESYVKTVEVEKVVEIPSANEAAWWQNGWFITLLLIGCLGLGYSAGESAERKRFAETDWLTRAAAAVGVTAAAYQVASESVRSPNTEPVEEQTSGVVVQQPRITRQ